MTIFTTLGLGGIFGRALWCERSTAPKPSAPSSTTAASSTPIRLPVPCILLRGSGAMGVLGKTGRLGGGPAGVCTGCAYGGSTSSGSTTGGVASETGSLDWTAALGEESASGGGSGGGGGGGALAPAPPRR